MNACSVDTPRTQSSSTASVCALAVKLVGGGGPSSTSSAIVSVAASGSVTFAVDELAIRSVLSPVLTASSTAVTVTVPVLAVAPAANVSVVFPLTVYCDAVASPWGVTVRYTATSEVGAGAAVAVTVATPPFSSIRSGSTERVMTGWDASPRGMALISSAISAGSSAQPPLPAFFRLPFAMLQPSRLVSEPLPLTASSTASLAPCFSLKRIQYVVSLSSMVSVSGTRSYHWPPTSPAPGVANRTTRFPPPGLSPL